MVRLRNEVHYPSIDASRLWIKWPEKAAFFPGKSAAFTPCKAGFTLIELLVVIAIVAILAAILFPVFARAREKARQASCSSNMKQIALGIMQYSQDYDEMLPPSRNNSVANRATPWHYLIQRREASIDG